MASSSVSPGSLGTWTYYYNCVALYGLYNPVTVEALLAIAHRENPTSLTKPNALFTVEIPNMSDDYKDIDFINLNDINLAPDTVPTAEYHLKIVEGDVRKNKAGDGYYVNYRTVVQSGPHAGASVYGVWSLKDKALWKMRKDFKAMEYEPAGGVPHIQDLLGFEGIAKVKEEPAKDASGEPTGDKRNSIDRWIGPLK